MAKNREVGVEAAFLPLFFLCLSFSSLSFLSIILLLTGALVLYMWIA